MLKGHQVKLLRCLHSKWNVKWNLEWSVKGSSHKRWLHIVYRSEFPQRSHFRFQQKLTLMSVEKNSTSSKSILQDIRRQPEFVPNSYFSHWTLRITLTLNAISNSILMLLLISKDQIFIRILLLTPKFLFIKTSSQNLLDEVPTMHLLTVLCWSITHPSDPK